MQKIVTVVGARPQFIKASVVSLAISKVPELDELIVHTGQHFDANMSDVFFTELGLPQPSYHLGIGGGGHGEMTGRMLIELEKVFLVEKPDIVLVYGDTNSTLAAAIAAAKLNIPIAHVEAGLRSYNMVMPEEINRILTDRVSAWLFAPTVSAVENLRKEGAEEQGIFLVGDVMYDAAIQFGAASASRQGLLGELGLASQGYALATVHRAENTNSSERLSTIVGALNRFSEHIPVVLSLHPRTREALKNASVTQLLSSVRIIDPVGYLEMVLLEKNAALIATDSGGVQKEAFFHKVPCVTFRDETEWTELLDAGWNRLAPPLGADGVYSVLRDALGSVGGSVNPYGSGDAASQVANFLRSLPVK